MSDTLLPRIRAALVSCSRQQRHRAWSPGHGARQADAPGPVRGAALGAEGEVLQPVELVRLRERRGRHLQRLLPDSCGCRGLICPSPTAPPASASAAVEETIPRPCGQITPHRSIPLRLLTATPPPPDSVATTPLGGHRAPTGCAREGTSNPAGPRERGDQGGPARTTCRPGAEQWVSGGMGRPRTPSPWRSQERRDGGSGDP
jgi:hypothetical protein